jgi:hypothetical protein
MTPDTLQGKDVHDLGKRWLFAPGTREQGARIKERYD